MSGDNMLKHIRLFFLVFVLLSQNGCVLFYGLQSGYGQMKLLSKRQPLEKVLADPNVSEKTKQKINLVVEAKTFGVDQLGLTPTKNFESYVDVGGPAVTYIVVAAKKCELKQHTFRYPILGDMPYKGYFDRKDADEEAAKFDRKEYDVLVRGVSAYSTLGWFQDPILSTMMNYDDYDLVDLIIHESTHSTIFIKSNADFNEQLATFIGQEGTKEFYFQKEGSKSKTVERMLADYEDQKLFAEFLKPQIQKLKEFYKTQGSCQDENRATAFSQIQLEFEKSVAPKLKGQNYKNFAKREMNNATLLYAKTYVGDLSLFADAYKSSKMNLKMFLGSLKKLEKEKDPIQSLKNLSQESGAAP
jgi:predicted aminopeptidase